MRFLFNKIKKADGYRGIWYYNQPLKNEYKFKYSGGLGTYCAKHIPFAWYDGFSKKTFFCYGGTKKKRNRLLHMVSYYDHNSGTVPKPTVLLNKKTDDAHDNPTILMDQEGYVWIFSSSHGTSRPSYIHRSQQPRSIDQFDRILKGNFSYPQVKYVDDRFFFLHTKYVDHKRFLAFKTSTDGMNWTERRFIARIEKGHYQVSNQHGGKIGSAFNYHPDPEGLNHRTNLYYMETPDLGRSWQNASGDELKVPLEEVDNRALAFDFEESNKLVYMKDLIFDDEGNPAILVIISSGFKSGPKNGPRKWVLVFWRDGRWQTSEITDSDSNYDMGSLYIQNDHSLRLVAPTETGPQPYNPGGEICFWDSDPAWKKWHLKKQLTINSQYNHTYVRRPVNAHDGFYAFWADGNPRKKSESRLHFCTKDGEVYRLPESMKGSVEKPERIKK